MKSRGLNHKNTLFSLFLKRYNCNAILLFVWWDKIKLGNFDTLFFQILHPFWNGVLAGALDPEQPEMRAVGTIQEMLEMTGRNKLKRLFRCGYTWALSKDSPASWNMSFYRWLKNSKPHQSQSSLDELAGHKGSIYWDKGGFRKEIFYIFFPCGKYLVVWSSRKNTGLGRRKATVQILVPSFNSSVNLVPWLNHTEPQLPSSVKWIWKVSSSF